MFVTISVKAIEFYTWWHNIYDFHNDKKTNKQTRRGPHFCCKLKKKKKKKKNDYAHSVGATMRFYLLDT